MSAASPGAHYIQPTAFHVHTGMLWMAGPTAAHRKPAIAATCRRYGFTRALATAKTVVRGPVVLSATPMRVSIVLRCHRQNDRSTQAKLHLHGFEHRRHRKSEVAVPIRLSQS